MSTISQSALPREIAEIFKSPFDVSRMSAAPRAPATTAAPAAQLQTGDVVQDGPNKGWIYCEGRDIEPFLVAPKDSGVMKWREAMDFAARENAAVPDRAQLDAMYQERNTGALKGTFNATGFFYPASWYWSATQNDGNGAWCRRFRADDQGNSDKFHSASVRCVRRYSII